MSKSINKLEIMEICASFKVCFMLSGVKHAYRKGKKSKVSSQRLLLVGQQEIKGF